MTSFVGARSICRGAAAAATGNEGEASRPSISSNPHTPAEAAKSKGSEEREVARPGPVKLAVEPLQREAATQERAAAQARKEETDGDGESERMATAAASGGEEASGERPRDARAAKETLSTDRSASVPESPSSVKSPQSCFATSPGIAQSHEARREESPQVPHLPSLKNPAQAAAPLAVGVCRSCNDSDQCANEAAEWPQQNGAGLQLLSSGEIPFRQPQTLEEAREAFRNKQVDSGCCGASTCASFDASEPMLADINRYTGSDCTIIMTKVRRYPASELHPFGEALSVAQDQGSISQMVHTILSSGHSGSEKVTGFCSWAGQTSCGRVKLHEYPVVDLRDGHEQVPLEPIQLGRIHLAEASDFQPSPISRNSAVCVSPDLVSSGGGGEALYASAGSMRF